MANEIGTYLAGTIIANVKTRLANFTEDVYPSQLILRDINNIISDLLAEGNLDEEDYNDLWLIPNTDDTVDLSIFSDYKLLRSISHIKSKGIKADNVNEKEFEVQKSYGSSGIYKNSIIYYRKGSKLYFYKGTGISDYGERYIYVNRLPYKATSLSSVVDVKDDKIFLVEQRLQNIITGNVPNIQLANTKVEKMKTGSKEEKAGVKEK